MKLDKKVKEASPRKLMLYLMSVLMCIHAMVFKPRKRLIEALLQVRLTVP